MWQPKTRSGNRRWWWATRSSGGAHFHRNTVDALAHLIAAAGLQHPAELRPYHIVRRVSPNEVRLVSSLLRFLKPGELLDEAKLADLPPVYGYYWPRAQAGSFTPVHGAGR